MKQGITEFMINKLNKLKHVLCHGIFQIRHATS